MTVSWPAARKASTSGLVISPRNTVDGFDMRFLLECPSGDVGRELADPLDPARHDVTGLEMAIGSRRRRQAQGRSGGDQVAGPELDVAAEERDDLADREPH